MSERLRPVPAPRGSGGWWVVLGGYCVAALWVATQYVAACWRYHPVLGTPVLHPTVVVRQVGLALTIVLGVTAGGVLLLAPRAWRIAVVATIMGGCVWVMTHHPLYPPYLVIRWAVLYHGVAPADVTLRSAFLVFCTTLAVGMIAVLILRRPRRSRPITDSHGTARWGVGEAFRGARGLVLGRLHGQLLRYSGDGHLVTIAPTRSGKGVGVVIPNLLTYPGSIIVTDPKGENYAVTARRRRDLGSDVSVFDPFRVTSGGARASFNPMDLMDGESPDASDDARLLADMLVVIEGREAGEQAFWNEEARALLTGLILHVATAALPEDRHLPRVRELLTLPPDEFGVLLKEMAASQAAGGLVSRAAARLEQKAEKERSGVISSAQSHTHFLDSPRMADVLCSSTVALSGLYEQSMTYYLVLPPDRLTTYQRWIRVMLACGIITLTRAVHRTGERRRPAHRVLFLLDEFAHLGRMQPIERDMSLVAGYGASFWLLVQDIAQLKAVYPDKWQSFLSNADVLQTFGTNDWDTAEYLSKMTGDATIHVESENRSQGLSHGKSGGRQESAAQTVSEKSRRLLLPDEVRRLPRSRQLLFHRGCDVVGADLIVYYREGEFLGYDPNPLVF